MKLNNILFLLRFLMLKKTLAFANASNAKQLELEG